MTTLDDIYGKPSGKTLKAADLEGEKWEVVITGWKQHTFTNTDRKTGEEYQAPRIILSFAGHEKELVVNRTNARIIEKAYGSDPSEWIGKTISMYEHETPIGPGIAVETIKKVRKIGATSERNPPPFDDTPF
jgi:hypothetical protein